MDRRGDAARPRLGPRPDALDAPVETLPGVGPAVRRKLVRLGLETVGDVLAHRRAEATYLAWLDARHLGEDPAGDVTLHFSEGAAIRLSVECIEAQMKDLGPVWEAVATPGHPNGA